MRYHEGQLAVQRRAGGDAQAERLLRGMRAELPEPARAFLAEQRLLVLAAQNAEGRVWASPLAGSPGFARAVAPGTLAIAARPHAGDPLAPALAARGPVPVGLLAIEPATRRRMRVNGLATPTADGLQVHTRQVYSNCPKYIARRAAGPEALVAAPVSERRAALSAGDLALVRAADTFFIATAGPDDARDASHRGGAPGFVHAAPDALSFPDYGGNAMYMTLGNLHADPAAGLLFVDWASGAALQVAGRAAIDWSPARAAALPGAERVVDVQVEHVVATAGALAAPWTFLEASRFNPPAA